VRAIFAVLLCFCSITAAMAQQSGNNRYRSDPVSPNGYDSTGRYHSNLNANQYTPTAPSTVTNSDARYRGQTPPVGANDPYGTMNRYQQVAPKAYGPR